MTDSPRERGNINAFVKFKTLPQPGMPIISGAPKKLSYATIEAMLASGETLLSWGELPKSFDFVQDVQIYMWPLVGLIGGAVGLETFRINGYIPLAVAMMFWFLWGVTRNVRRPWFVLTNQRLIKIDQFINIFELSLFERAVLQKNKDGAECIELWTKTGSRPNVILQLGQEPSKILAMLPPALASSVQAAALPPSPHAAEDNS